ncbi:hypothetical protein V5799_022254 [Amblyomma americanum]|uniref:Tripartite motif-containing protein 45 n=1 Tax=Amblyomma americanum TaxID=6943 RepID=A0AAQ4FLC6_AMBAM
MSRPANNEFRYKAPHRLDRLDLQCPACLEKLQDPRILPCLHTLCRRCIERLSRCQRRLLSSRPSAARYDTARAICTREEARNALSATESWNNRGPGGHRCDDRCEERTGAGVIVCPTCQNECVVSATQNELPENVLVRQFLGPAPDPLGSWQHSGLKQPASRGKSSSLCDLCAKSRAAVNRCIGCLVSCCTRVRRRQPGGDSRSTWSPAQKRLERGDQNARTMAPLDLKACPLHPMHQMDIFCVTCRRTICASCLSRDHTDHVSSDIGTAKEKVLKRTGLLLTRLQSKMSKLENSANGTLKKTQALSRNASEVTHEVNSFYDGYVSALEARRRELLDEITNFQQVSQKSLRDRSSTLEAALVRARSVHEFGKTLLHFGHEMPEVVLPLVEVLDRAARPIVVMDEKEDISACQPLSLRFRRDKEDHRGEYLVYGAVSRQADPSVVSAVLSFKDPANSQRFGSTKAARLKFLDSSGHPLDVGPEQVRAALFSTKSASKTEAEVTRAVDDPLQLRLEFDTKNAGTHALAVTLDDQPVLGSPFLFKVKSRKPRCAGNRALVASSPERSSAYHADKGFLPQSASKRQRNPGDDDFKASLDKALWEGLSKPCLQPNLSGSDVMSNASSRSSRLYQFTA